MQCIILAAKNAVVRSHQSLFTLRERPPVVTMQKQFAPSLLPSIMKAGN